MKHRTIHRPPPGQARTLSPEQKAALERLLSASHHLGGRSPSRDEMHEKPCQMDIDDLREGLERANNPTDPVLDWEEVKRDLLDQD